MVDPKVDMLEKLEVVDKFTDKLKTSGYNQNQCQELVTSGVRGFMNKWTNKERNREEFYRSAKSTLGKRINKKAGGNQPNDHLHHLPAQDTCIYNIPVIIIFIWNVWSFNFIISLCILCYFPFVIK